MRKTKETREILTEWRNFEKNKERQLINEIDLSTVFQSASEFLSTAGPYLATLGGTIVGSAIINHIFDTLKYKFFTKGENLEALETFIDLTVTFGKKEDWNYEWCDVLRDINSKYEIQKWAANSGKEVQKHFKNAKKNYKSLDDSSFSEDLKSDIASEMKGYISTFNAKDAIEKFDKLKNSGDVDAGISDKISSYIFDNCKRIISDFNIKKIRYDDAKTHLFIDATLLTMLQIYDYHLSESAVKLNKNIKKLNSKFSQDVEIKESESGLFEVVIGNDASLECIMAYANLYTSEENKNGQVLVNGSKEIETAFIKSAGSLRDFKTRTRALRDVLKFVKRAMMTTASGGLSLFIQAFVKEFAQDEVLSEISEQCQDYLDSKSDISDSDDITITEFVKAIIAVLLE